MKNKLIKGLAISLATLAIGFVAISLPFQLFKTMDSAMMSRVFIGEIVIYTALGLIFLLFQDKKQSKRKKQTYSKTKSKSMTAQQIIEEYNLAA